MCADILDTLPFKETYVRIFLVWDKVLSCLNRHVVADKGTDWLDVCICLYQQQTHSRVLRHSEMHSALLLVVGVADLQRQSAHAPGNEIYI